MGDCHTKQMQKHQRYVLGGIWMQLDLKIEILSSFGGLQAAKSLVQAGSVHQRLQLRSVCQQLKVITITTGYLDKSDKYISAIMYGTASS